MINELKDVIIIMASSLLLTTFVKAFTPIMREIDTRIKFSISTILEMLGLAVLLSPLIAFFITFTALFFLTQVFSIEEEVLRVIEITLFYSLSAIVPYGFFSWTFYDRKENIRDLVFRDKAFVMFKKALPIRSFSSSKNKEMSDELYFGKLLSDGRFLKIKIITVFDGSLNRIGKIKIPIYASETGVFEEYHENHQTIQRMKVNKEENNENYFLFKKAF